jgi:uncharacterized protein (TIGR02145 family)
MIKPKTTICIYTSLIIGFLILVSVSCKKDNDNTSDIPSTVTDIDGNVYHTITIGKQTWMVENLKTTRFRNGDSIPNIKVDSTWSKLTTAAYCNIGNDTSLGNIYGRLYNIAAVHEVRNICPVGWHVPTDADWGILSSELGHNEIAGGKMKETGTSHWASPNTGATNESGFTALPGGMRTEEGHFQLLTGASIWFISGSNPTFAMTRSIFYQSAVLEICGWGGTSGYSVRCIMD